MKVFILLPFSMYLRNDYNTCIVTIISWCYKNVSLAHFENIKLMNICQHSIFWSHLLGGFHFTLRFHVLITEYGFPRNKWRFEFLKIFYSNFCFFFLVLQRSVDTFTLIRFNTSSFFIWSFIVVLIIFQQYLSHCCYCFNVPFICRQCLAGLHWNRKYRISEDSKFCISTLSFQDISSC